VRFTDAQVETKNKRGRPSKSKGAVRDFAASEVADASFARSSNPAIAARTISAGMLPSKTVITCCTVQPGGWRYLFSKSKSPCSATSWQHGNTVGGKAAAQHVHRYGPFKQHVRNSNGTKASQTLKIRRHCIYRSFIARNSSIMLHNSPDRPLGQPALWQLCVLPSSPAFWMRGALCCSTFCSPTEG
jgi:hypothetical protein